MVSSPSAGISPRNHGRTTHPSRPRPLRSIRHPPAASQSNEDSPAGSAKLPLSCLPPAMMGRCGLESRGAVRSENGVRYYSTKGRSGPKECRELAPDHLLLIWAQIYTIHRRPSMVIRSRTAVGFSTIIQQRIRNKAEWRPWGTGKDDIVLPLIRPCDEKWCLI